MTTLIIQSLPDYTHAQLVTATGRAFLADEPRQDDGDDFGPTPYELLTAALGACTAMTLQIYARRKEIPLEEVVVEVEHERIHAVDCESCDDPKHGFIEALHRRIVVRGPLSDAQRDDLLRVANRCPVHKTLSAVPRILDSIEVVS